MTHPYAKAQYLAFGIAAAVSIFALLLFANGISFANDKVDQTFIAIIFFTSLTGVFWAINKASVPQWVGWALRVLAFLFSFIFFSSITSCPEEVTLGLHSARVFEDENGYIVKDYWCAVGFTDQNTIVIVSKKMGFMEKTLGHCRFIHCCHFCKDNIPKFLPDRNCVINECFSQSCFPHDPCDTLGLEK